jgi:hypothetical protein
MFMGDVANLGSGDHLYLTARLARRLLIALASLVA